MILTLLYLIPLVYKSFAGEISNCKTCGNIINKESLNFNKPFKKNRDLNTSDKEPNNDKIYANADDELVCNNWRTQTWHKEALRRNLDCESLNMLDASISGLSDEFCLVGTKSIHLKVNDECLVLMENKNYSNAYNYFKKFAQKGNANAQFNLANLYRKGFGIRKDYSQAYYWYKLSAKQKNLAAMTRLGYHYYFGVQVKKDFKKAYKLFKEVIFLGRDDAVIGLAVNKIGMMYVRGTGGLIQNYKDAHRWFEISSNTNYAPGQYNLGVSYSKGHGPSKKINYKKANFFYNLASNQGHKLAQNNLGLSYLKGRGQKNVIEGLKWLLVSSEQNGYEKATKNIKKYKYLYTSKELAKAKSLANNFKKNIVYLKKYQDIKTNKFLIVEQLKKEKKLEKFYQFEATEKKLLDETKLSNYLICYYLEENHLSFTKQYYDKDKLNKEAKNRGLDCGVKEQNKVVIASKPNNNKTSILSKELDNEIQKRKDLEKKLAFLEKEKQKRIDLEKKLAALQFEKKEQIKKAKENEIGSGFYVSKFRHIVTNQHVVNKCKKITVGDSISKQIPATLVASNKRDDLAILQTISMEMASAETKSFIQNLSIEIVPIISGGLMRSEDVKGGEDIVVAGYPLGNMVSDTIKVTKGIVSATRGMNNNFSQFEIDAVIRKGNSGGPIYDKRGNIVGVAVSRLNVNRTDTINFGIKGSTVKQFLSANDVPTTWANRAQRINTQDLYKIASKQTVMVVCHR